MNGTGENRWRRPGQANRQEQSRNPGANPPAREGGKTQASVTNPGNVSGGKGKAAGSASAAQHSVPAADHVPVRGFNSTEVRDFLRKKYIDNTAGNPAVHYKVQGDSGSPTSKAAWSSRSTMPHQMLDGQDFFAVLRKQLIMMEQSNPTQ